MDRLEVNYDYKEVNVDHVATLGESGPTESRVCHDPAPSTEGWIFFSRVLAEP